MRRAPRRPAGRRACARRMCVLRRSGRVGLISSPVENVLYQLVFSLVRAFCVTCQLITCKVCSRARISIGITFNHVKGGLQSTRTDLGRTSVPRERDTGAFGHGGYGRQCGGPAAMPRRSRRDECGGRCACCVGLWRSGAGRQWAELMQAARWTGLTAAARWAEPMVRRRDGRR